jgi:MerR family copper efflux transcriptional regulator
MRISEVAARTGFTPATLRYYETIGLVTAPARTDGGYRLYDDRALARLEFIGRAKRLGLSLDEVRELAAAWDGDECASVQARMAGLVSAKLDAVNARIAELSAFAEQLRSVVVDLSQPPSSGGCDAGCACNSAGGPRPVELLPRNGVADRDGPR